MTNYFYSQCSICGITLTYNPRDWYCKDCYETYKQDIINKSGWTSYRQLEEKSRRYREQDIRKLGVSYIYGLGFCYDYDVENGKLVALRTYYEED